MSLSGMIVVVGHLLGGLSCIVQIVGLRDDEVCNDTKLAAVALPDFGGPIPRFLRSKQVNNDQ